MTRQARRQPAKIFGWPALIAAATVTGLVAGLVGGPGWDWAAWGGLLAPVGAACVRRPA